MLFQWIFLGIIVSSMLGRDVITGGQVGQVPPPPQHHFNKIFGSPAVISGSLCPKQRMKVSLLVVGTYAQPLHNYNLHTRYVIALLQPSENQASTKKIPF